MANKMNIFLTGPKTSHYPKVPAVYKKVMGMLGTKLRKYVAITNNLEQSDEIWVVTISGWEECCILEEEIALAVAAHIPIRYLPVDISKETCSLKVTNIPARITHD